MSERPCVFTYRSEDDHSLDKCRCGHYLSDHDWPPKPFDYEADWKRLSAERASLLARAEQAERERDAALHWKEKAERALSHLSPNGRPGVQLYLDEDSGAPDMPMFGIVETYSPYIIADEMNEDGSYDVYQWRYDEESFSCEMQTAGYLIDDEWLCTEDEKRDAAIARAERAEAERDALRAKVERVRASALHYARGEGGATWSHTVGERILSILDGKEA
jgi:hypothetical protein